MCFFVYLFIEFAFLHTQDPTFWGRWVLVEELDSPTSVDARWRGLFLFVFLHLHRSHSSYIHPRTRMHQDTFTFCLLACRNGKTDIFEIVADLCGIYSCVVKGYTQ
jgi:hypothetical protein